MPTGTCRVCGCTEMRACEDGCRWADRERTVCSQCIGWAVLREPNPYVGVFAYGLVPIRNLVPSVVPCGVLDDRPVAAYYADLRRMDEETLSRVATICAPMNDNTVENFLASIRDPDCRFPLDCRCIRATFDAPDIGRAVEMVEEWRATGVVSGATKREVKVYAAILKPVPSTGGACRG